MSTVKGALIGLILTASHISYYIYPSWQLNPSSLAKPCQNPQAGALKGVAGLPLVVQLYSLKDKNCFSM